MSGWKKLEQILRNQIEEHLVLIEAIDSLKNAVSSRKIDEIESLIMRQNEICQRISSLEEERRKLCVSLTGEKSIGIAEVISRAPRHHQRVLFVLGQELKKLVSKAQIEAKTMRYVVNTILHYVGQILDLYFSKEVSVYTPAGQTDRKRGLLCSVRA